MKFRLTVEIETPEPLKWQDFIAAAKAIAPAGKVKLKSLEGLDNIPRPLFAAEKEPQP